MKDAQPLAMAGLCESWTDRTTGESLDTMKSRGKAVGMSRALCLLAV